MRIAIVTGGLGFIGKHLVSEISDRYSHIIIVDNLSLDVHPLQEIYTPKLASVVVGEVQNPDTWLKVSKLLPNEEYSFDVFHLAADTSTGNSINSPSKHVASNSLGTAVLCEFLAQNISHLRRIVLTSTRAVYGEGLWLSKSEKIVNPSSRTQNNLALYNWNPEAEGGSCLRPIGVNSDKCLPNPVNIYGSTKFNQESILKIWSDAFNVELRIFRLQNVYGPGQSLWNSYSGVTSLFVKNALTKQPIEVYEGGGIVRDLVFVRDVVKVLAHEFENQDRFSILDVGSGLPVSLLEVASLIAKKCRVSDPLISNKFRSGDVRGIYADNSKLMELGILPAFTSLKDGISQLLVWAKTEIDNGSAN